ncbi:MAG: sulfatase [Opitutaceae bacterium]|nr:sulfatase [Cytophagales bacterium]
MQSRFNNTQFSGKIFLALAFLYLAAALNLQAQEIRSQKKPNVIFILADDLGMNDLACYGNPFNETPQIDQLAKTGIRFTQAYAASPLCSPTRASILTGKYPARLQFTNFDGGNRTDQKSPVLPAKWKSYLESKETTLAELFKQNGYTTGMVGKWHLGNADSIAPWNQGFDYSRVIGKNGLDYYNYSVYIDSYKKEFTDHGTQYLTDKLTEYGVDFIKENSKKPFFLYLAYSAPHVLLVPRADKLGKYFIKYAKFDKKYNPNYAATIESLDDGVGVIMRTLEDQGLLENTLVIFTSDNGALGLDELGPVPASSDPLRKWKGHIYEGGIRIPAIVSWTGKIAPGTISGRYFSTIDYLPTLCDLTGVTKLPENVDGQSILPELFDPGRGITQSNPLFWHYPHFSNQLGRPAGAVRLGDFKLVENYENGKLALYNLKDDISESMDLSLKMKEKTQELYRLLKGWRKQMNAQMPVSKARL